MPCYHPLTGEMGVRTKSDGTRYSCWIPNPEVSASEAVKVPCGQCLGCRIADSRQKAIRTMHSLQMSSGLGCFLTLTYAPEHVPNMRWLERAHLVNFIKALRGSLHPTRIQILAGGEYGERSGHPHYHLCIIGWEPPHHERLYDSKQYLYSHPLVSELWHDGSGPRGQSGNSRGFHNLGSLTFESAAYVARYIIKKQKGALTYSDPDSGVQMRINEKTGETKPNEFAYMSRRPALGRTWFDKYWSDIYPHDFCIIGDHKTRPPRYYDRLLEQSNPDLFEQVKSQRKEESESRNEPLDRLIQKEIVAKAKYDLYHQRNL